MRYLLDTNICIYIINKKPIKVLENLKKYNSNEFALSSITVAELYYGTEKSQYIEKNKLALEHFLVPFEILPFDENVAITYGHLRAVLEKTGNIIGPLDLLIAAQAISAKLILITNNTKEFKKVPHLKVENLV